MKRPPFQFDHRRGLAAPLCHAEYFTEPLSLASGLADCTGPGSPGTFGKLKGKLRKAKSLSSLRSQRWHHPAGQAAAARTDRLLGGIMAKLLRPPPSKLKVKDLEHERARQGDALQRTRLHQLTARYLA